MPSVEPPPPVASLRSDAARNRARVLDAARAALAEGDRTLGANGLARRAGVGVGTVYRHFPNRQTLMEGLAFESFAALVEDVEAAAADPDPAAGLHAVLDASLRRMDADPGLTEVLALETPICVETIGLGRQFVAAGRELIRRAHATGALRPDLDLGDLRRLLVGLHTAGHLDGAGRARRARYLEVLVAGLRRPA